MAFEYDFPKFNKYSDYVIGRCKRDETLLPHQREGLDKLHHWFSPESETAEHVAVVSMPTGSGKTGIICCLPYFIGGIRDQSKGNEQPYFYEMDKPVLVIAPDLAIADQLERKMSNSRLDGGENFLKERGIVEDKKRVIRSVIPSGLTIESTSQLVQPQHILTKDIVIANAQKFLSKERGSEWEERLPDDHFKLVIVDEAHHHPAPTWKRIMDKFSRHAKVFFFTATPFRADGKQVVENLGKFAYELRRDRAIGEGIIRRTVFKEENQLPNFISEEKWFQDILGGENHNQIKLLSFAQILIRARELQLRKNEENPLPGGVPHMIMAVTKENKEADQLLKIWENRFPEDQASVYHSQLKKYQLKETMKRLKNNELKLVIVCSMLLEGFDHPPISIAAVACNIGSPVRFSQFVGRAQRIVRSHGIVERNGVAHVVSHDYFNQAGNYNNYEAETFGI